MKKKSSSLYPFFPQILWNEKFADINIGFFFNKKSSFIGYSDFVGDSDIGRNILKSSWKNPMPGKIS